jgi:hypothetical protein
MPSSTAVNTTFDSDGTSATITRDCADASARAARFGT